MTVESFALGALETNSYVISETGTPDCWVFDCPGDPEPLLQALGSRNAVPRGIFLTHAHFDHMAGLDTFRKSYPGTPVFQHKLEASWLQNPVENLSSWGSDSVTVEPATGFLEDGQTIQCGTWSIKVLHVPGHSPGSLAFWFESEDEVIVGDVLFRSGVGRWDFPGCDREALRASLDRLCTLPDQTRVRPGHRGSTTIGREKASNPYLRSEDAWG